jgi:hypothetical protein
MKGVGARVGRRVGAGVTGGIGTSVGRALGVGVTGGVGTGVGRGVGTSDTSASKALTNPYPVLKSKPTSKPRVKGSSMSTAVCSSKL